MRRIGSNRQRILAASAIAAIVALRASGASNWTNPAGGTFNDPLNWNNGAGPAPVAGDAVEFSLADSYAVSFSSDTGAGLQLIQSDGDVVWQSDNSPREISFDNVYLTGGTLTLASAPSPLTLTTVLEVSNGADITVHGPVTLTEPPNAGSSRSSISGTGTTFSQAGNHPMTIGLSSGEVTYFDVNARAVVDTGTGLLTVNKARVNVSIFGSLNVNGDIRVNADGKLDLTSWAPARTMNVEAGGLCEFINDVTLAGNIINLNGQNSTLNGNTVTLTGGASINAGGALSGAQLAALNLATDGSSASLHFGASQSANLITRSGPSTWGANGGTATVTLDAGANVDIGYLQGLNIASTGTGTTAVVTVRSEDGRQSLLKVSALNVQNATTSGASAEVTIEGAGAWLDQANTPTSTIGGATGTGVATINVRDGGKLTTMSSLILNPTATLNIDNGIVEVGKLIVNSGKANFRSGLLSIGAVPAMNEGGQLDINDNALVVRNANVGSWNGSNYSHLTRVIASGRNGGGWDGTGVITSMTDAAAGVTAIGVATAAQVVGIGPSQTALWAGYTISTSDALVMYTYGGDANLSGHVDIDDYGLIDFNASTGGFLNGWYYGDFDYSGMLDVDDYGIIDFVVNIQGAPFATSSEMILTSVPEPSAACGVAVFLSAIASGRRKQR